MWGYFSPCYKRLNINLNILYDFPNPDLISRKLARRYLEVVNKFVLDASNSSAHRADALLMNKTRDQLSQPFQLEAGSLQYRFEQGDVVAVQTPAQKQ